jgi:hypothetical protein
MARKGQAKATRMLVIFCRHHVGVVMRPRPASTPAGCVQWVRRVSCTFRIFIVLTFRSHSQIHIGSVSSHSSGSVSSHGSGLSFLLGEG